MKIVVRNPQNDTTRKAELFDDVTLSEFAGVLEEADFIKRPKGGEGYQFMNKRTSEELPGNTTVDKLDILEGDVISIYAGTVVA